MASIKRLFYHLFEGELLGRISRKVVYSTAKLLQKLTHEVNYLHATLPYIKKLERSLNKNRMTLISKYYAHLKNHTQIFKFQPKISVLVPVYKTNYAYLKECLESVIHQIYPNWELCIVDDCSNDPQLTAIIENYQRQFPDKIKFAKTPSNEHISGASNLCLSLATGDYIALLDHDDRMVLHALSEVVRYINLHNEPEVLYSDERVITEAGEWRNWPFYKPDWAPYMHLCMNYTTHLSVYRTALIKGIGGFRKGFEGSQDHDLMLRATEASRTPIIHIPFCLYQWRAHAESTAHSIAAKPYAAIAGEKAISEALTRRGIPGTAEYESETCHYRLRFEMLEASPKVSIIIPSRDNLNVIKTCIQSIIEKSTYSNYDIIIADNGTTDREVLAYYDDLKRSLGQRFQANIKPGYFNFARQINDGMKYATGNYCLLLNNDVEVITPNWIEELLQLAQLPDVGAVGCKLLYPEDDSIQHAGIVSAGKDIAVHAGAHLQRRTNLYLSLLNTIHEVFAVTAACLMIKKSALEKVGGLDEKYLANGYGDLELCIKLRKIGFTCLYTPYAELYHYESKTRGMNIEYFERYYLYNHYGQDLLRDPYLHPNLFAHPTYEIDHFYRGLDLNNEEFMFFMKNPPEKWASLISSLK